MIDHTSNRVTRSPGTNRFRIAVGTATVSFLAALLLAATAATPAHADNGDCAQPLTSGEGPSASDCLFVLRAAVGSSTCDPECICAPKGTLPISTSDALLCLRFAVGHAVVLNCPCEEPTTTTVPSTTTTTNLVTTTTLGSGVVGAIPLQGRMNANLEVGLDAAAAACEQHFPGSHYCEYDEIVASQGAKLAGLEDINDDPVTSFWAIDPNQSVARQCGETLSAGAERWVYATAHLGVGGDSVPLENATGTLGDLIVGGGGTRNCGSIKSVACCQ